LNEITFISLHANNLSGSIPKIGQLTNLRSLDLSNNGLSGVMPTVYKLQLDMLYLNNNKLTGKAYWAVCKIPDLRLGGNKRLELCV